MQCLENEAKLYSHEEMECYAMEKAEKERHLPPHIFTIGNICIEHIFSGSFSILIPLQINRS